MNKRELRNTMLIIRKSVTNKKEKSTTIVEKIKKLDVYKKAKVIALYNSMPDEVNTKLLISVSLNNKIVLLPKVIDNQMVFIKIDKDTKYTKSTLGILEPIGEEYIGNIDLIIVPGIAFDKSLNRLGFGKGYYDKYLGNKDIYKIGICFRKQLIDNVLVNNLDIPVNLVVTEKEF